MSVHAVDAIHLVYNCTIYVLASNTLKPNPLAPKLGLLIWITHSISLAKGDLGFTLVDLVLHEDFPGIFRLEVTNESRIP